MSEPLKLSGDMKEIEINRKPRYTVTLERDDDKPDGKIRFEILQSFECASLYEALKEAFRLKSETTPETGLCIFINDGGPTACFAAAHNDKWATI